jgi:hypothetical protein
MAARHQVRGDPPGLVASQEPTRDARAKHARERGAAAAQMTGNPLLGRLVRLARSTATT